MKVGASSHLRGVMMISSKPSTRRKGSPVVGLSSSGSSCGFLGCEEEEEASAMSVSGCGGRGREERAPLSDVQDGYESNLKW